MNNTYSSQKAKNKAISQCPNHYYPEYAFILNFDLNKRNINTKKHIYFFLDFLLRKSWKGKDKYYKQH